MQRKSDHLKLLHGTSRKDRHRSETTPAAGAPVCPSFLSGEAKKEWRHVSKLLVEAGVLSQLDKAALAAYCQAWSDFVQACEELSTHELTYTANNGIEAPNPLLSIVRTASEQLRKWSAEFGFTPAARTRLNFPAPSAGPNPLEKYLRRQRLFGPDAS